MKTRWVATAIGPSNERHREFLEKFSNITFPIKVVCSTDKNASGSFLVYLKLKQPDFFNWLGENYLEPFDSRYFKFKTRETERC